MVLLVLNFRKQDLLEFSFFPAGGFSLPYPDQRTKGWAPYGPAFLFPPLGFSLGCFFFGFPFVWFGPVWVAAWVYALIRTEIRAKQPSRLIRPWRRYAPKRTSFFLCSVVANMGLCTNTHQVSRSRREKLHAFL